MIRRILATGALGCAMLLAVAAPGRAQLLPPRLDPRVPLYGHWKLVYMDGATCGYGAIVIAPPNPIGRVEASVHVTCTGGNSIYVFNVLFDARNRFVFQGASTSGAAGVGPNRLKFELEFNRFDCTLSGRWLIDAPIGRMVLRKTDPCPRVRASPADPGSAGQSGEDDQ